MPLFKPINGPIDGVDPLNPAPRARGRLGKSPGKCPGSRYGSLRKTRIPQYRDIGHCDVIRINQRAEDTVLEASGPYSSHADSSIQQCSKPIVFSAKTSVDGHSADQALGSRFDCRVGLPQVASTGTGSALKYLETIAPMSLRP